MKTKEEKSTYAAEWYRTKITAEAKERKIRLQRERRENLRQQIWEYKANHPCVDCGETDPIVLEFDHIQDDKIDDVAALIQRGFAWSKIEQEIAKCVVRCANCHRRITHKRRMVA